MKRLLLPLLVIIGFALCSFATDAVFNKDGITFQVPQGWKISEEENLEGQGYYVSCEKDGANESGLVTLSWINESRDLQEIMGTYKESLQTNFTAKNATPKFTAEQAVTYGAFKGIKHTYTLTLQKVAHQGSLYCLRACGKTLTIIVQEAVEDNADNVTGFKAIETSLKCAGK